MAVPPPESGRRLGRGLDALIGARKPSTTADTTTSNITEQTPTGGNRLDGALREIEIGHIRPNPFQPRTEFRPEQLADLEASLKINGLLQPITVRPAAAGTGYELIAGERRYRAASRLGWTSIPALIKTVTDREALSLALVENLQRADLDPIEEAEGYQRLQQEFNATQQQVADAVGKDRSTVTNALRLLQLPASVRRLLQDGQITNGHARAMLGLTSERDMADLAREAATAGLSVREVERRVKNAKPASNNQSGNTASGGRTSSSDTSRSVSAEVRRIEELLRRRLQTSVKIASAGRDQGELQITFTSNEDLERLLELMGVSLE